MPALGMTQDSGDILSWHKSVGDAIAADEVLMDIETDKTTMEMEAGFDGYVAEIRAPAGTTVAVGEVIAILTSEAPEGVVASVAAVVERSVSEPVTSSSEILATQDATLPVAVQEPDKAAKVSDSVSAVARESGRASTLAPNSVNQATTSASRFRPVVSDGERLLASPKARLLAHQRGVSLEQLVRCGIEQPLQSIDIENHIASPGVESTSTSILQARVNRSAFDAFANWASEESQDSLTMAHAWSLFAAGAFRLAWQVEATTALVVCAETWIDRERDLSSIDADLGGLYDIVVAEPDAIPDLRLRILVGTALVNYQPAVHDPEPVLTIVDSKESLLLSLSFDEERVGLNVAQTFLTVLGDRVLQPLRQLL